MEIIQLLSYFAYILIILKDQIVTSELSNVGLDYVLSEVMLNGAENMKELGIPINNILIYIYLEFKEKDEKFDCLKIEGERYTIYYHENSQLVEIESTHNGIGELLR